MKRVHDGIHAAIREELELRYPDLGAELFSFNQHIHHVEMMNDGYSDGDYGDEGMSDLAHYFPTVGRRGGFDEIDDAKEIQGWDTERLQGYIDLADRLEHSVIVEYLENYRDLLAELTEIFESENPQEWHERAIARVRSDFKVPASTINHPDVLKRIEGDLRMRIPFSEEPEATYAQYRRNLTSWNRRRLKRIDRAEMAGIDMPDILVDRPPLTQFLGTRYFLELSVGERRVLMKELEDVPEGEATLRFFEAAGLHKVGQFLSVWPEVPTETQAELSVLQDNVAPSNWEDVRNTILAIYGDEKGGDLLDHIVVLDPATGRRCLKAGTIGEDYLVQWDDGRKEILKVIPRAKRAKIEKALERIEAVRKRLAPNARIIEGGLVAMDILSRIINTMKEELNLANDIRNAEIFEGELDKAYADEPAIRARYIIPSFNADYVDRDAILMSYEEGHRITEIDDPAVVQEALDLLESLLFTTIYAHDMAPEDLHPGNFLIRNGGSPEDVKIVLLDFGRMVALTQRSRSKIIDFVTSIMEMDAKASEEPAFDGIVSTLESMSTRRPTYDREKLTEAVTIRMRDSDFDTPDDLFDDVQDLLMLAGKHGLSVGEVYLKVLKAISTFQGTKRVVGEKLFGDDTIESRLEVSRSSAEEEGAGESGDKVQLTAGELRVKVLEIIGDYVDDVDSNDSRVATVIGAFRDGTFYGGEVKGPLLRLGVDPDDLSSILDDLSDLV